MFFTHGFFLFFFLFYFILCRLGMCGAVKLCSLWFGMHRKLHPTHKQRREGGQTDRETREGVIIMALQLCDAE